LLTAIPVGNLVLYFVLAKTNDEPEPSLSTCSNSQDSFKNSCMSKQ